MKTISAIPPKGSEAVTSPSARPSAPGAISPDRLIPIWAAATQAAGWQVSTPAYPPARLNCAAFAIPLFCSYARAWRSHSAPIRAVRPALNLRWFQLYMTILN